MPLQQIQLDQSIYNKQKPKWGSNVQRSPVSQALQPQKGGTQFLGTMDTTNRFVEEQKAKWAAEDKAKKAEREAQSAKLQEVGMQTIGQAQQQQKQVQQQQAATTKQIEDNPEPAAKEMYELMKTLPDEAKAQLLNQIFTPTSTGGFIEAGGVKKDMPDKYNPIANVFIEKGWAMFDQKGNVSFNEAEDVYEKTTFKEMSDGSILNTATGEIIAKNGDIPPDWGETYTETLTEGLKYIGEMFDASWMQTMSTDEMTKYISDKKTAYRDWIASRLFSKGMTDKKEINRLADLAVGSYKWEKHIDEAKAREGGTVVPPTNTNRGLPLNEEVVTGLKQLFKDNPEALDDLDSYRDEYGDASVDAALKEETIPPPKPTTTKPTTLSDKQERFKKWGAL